jgi:hypothetical protein
VGSAGIEATALKARPRVSRGSEISIGAAKFARGRTIATKTAALALHVFPVTSGMLLPLPGVLTPINIAIVVSEYIVALCRNRTGS